MEAAAPRAETASVSGSTHTIPRPEPAELVISPSSAPSSPTPTGTLTRLGLKSPGGPASPGAASQVSAITVVALLEKLTHMMEKVQENQRRMEQRQGDLEEAVRVVQGDVSRLSRAHLGTANSVNKLLERSRKVNGNVKEVKERLDRQAVQVKRLEANHHHLLRRNNFKVHIFQEDSGDIPSDLMVKDSPKTPQPSQYDAESTQPVPSVSGSVEAIRTHDEALQTVSLSSDDDGTTHGYDQDNLVFEAEGISPIQFERRADRFKRNSLKKVDSLKKAFTKEKMQKRVNQISSKIVAPEMREKLKKSFTPNHIKSPTSKVSSFKVTPMTFSVKKVRQGDSPKGEVVSPVEGDHVKIPPLEGLDAEVHSPEMHTQDESVEEVQVKEIPISQESPKAEVSVNGNGNPLSIECEINGGSVAGLAVPEHDDDVGEEDEDEEEDEKNSNDKEPVENEATAKITAETNPVEPVPST